MAVIGACITAAIMPAIPAIAKFLPEPPLRCNSKSVIPKSRQGCPKKRVGAKIPPLPPAPLVVAVAAIFTSIMTITRTINASLSSRKLKEGIVHDMMPKVIDYLVDGVVSLPQREGKRKIIPPKAKPPITIRSNGLLIFFKLLSINRFPLENSTENNPQKIPSKMYQ